MLRKSQLVRIHQVLSQGGVIAYPTESVYGLGCDPNNQQSLQKILNIKRRPSHKGLIILVSQIEQAFPYLQALSAEQLDRLNQPQRRATTWLIPRRENLSELLCGQHPKLAVRLCQHPSVQAICNRINGPLVSTSCNLFGKKEMTNVTEVRNKMATQVDLIVDGVCGGQAPSQIIDLDTGQIIRN